MQKMGREEGGGGEGRLEGSQQIAEDHAGGGSIASFSVYLSTVLKPPQFPINMLWYIGLYDVGYSCY